MKRMRIVVVALCCCIAVSTGWGQITLGAGVFATGGGMFSGATYAAAGSIGQGVIGRSTGTSFAASAGFWGDGGIILDVEGLAGAEEPGEFDLRQNYPNPFNPLTRIELRIRNSDFLVLKIYDLLGREVAVLINEMKDAGTYTVDFDGSALASGVYIYRMTSGSFIQTRRMILLR